MEPRPIGESLREFIKRSPEVRRSKATLAMSTLWTEIAGQDVAAHTQVRGARLGVLTIVVDSPPLCHELAAFRRVDLLARMNERLGTKQLKDLYFRHGPS
jgi:predicted nucleic acid-binding Zn ribbon protein